MSDQDKKKNLPALNIFAKVAQPDGSTKIGSQIGVAWSFSEGKEGFTIVMDSVPYPLPGTNRVELLAFPVKDNS